MRKYKPEARASEFFRREDEISNPMRERGARPMALSLDL